MQIGIENHHQRQDTSVDHNYSMTYGNSKRKDKTKTGPVENPQPNSRQCNNCGKFVNRKWIKRHMKIFEKKQIRTARHNFSVRIDPTQGIYCSSKAIKDRLTPVHLIKKKKKKKKKKKNI